MQVVLSPKGWPRLMSTLGVDIYPGVTCLAQEKNNTEPEIPPRVGWCDADGKVEGRLV